jgi:two-component system, sensor histidine kinase LadS
MGLRKFAMVCCALLCSLWVPHSAVAQDLGRLFDDSPQLTLAAPLQWQATAKGAVQNPAEFNDPTKNQAFAIAQPSLVLPTGKGREVWLRFALPATANPQMWFLRMPRLQIERVTFFMQEPSGRWMQQVAGESVAPIHWPLRTRTPSFEMHTLANQSQWYYLKLEHRVAITERPQLVAPLEYIDSASRVGSIIGLMIGLFGLLAALGCATAWLYRNTHYLIYAVVVIFLLFAQLVLIGYASQRWWPGSVFLNQAMGWMTALWALAAGIGFTAYISYSKDNYPWIYRCAIGLMVVLVGVSVVYAVMLHDFPREVLNALAALSILWVIGSNAWIAWRSQPWLWSVVAGFTPLALSILARLAYNLGWLKHVELVQLASVLLGCLGMLVIYIGMILRSRESYGLLERETALAHTDISTGLTLERIAAIRLPQVLLRSKRFGKPCGVVMVRWVSQAAQLAPMTAAERSAVMLHFGSRLRRIGRDIDTVARYGDDHFVFLIESPVTRDNLNDLGTRILSSCMRPVVQLGGDGYTVHVAIAVIEGGNISSKELIESLRTRLNQMDANTPRRMQFVDSPMSTRPPEGADNATINGPALVAKINALEATHVLPKLAPLSDVSLVTDNDLDSMVGRSTGTTST